MTLELTTLKSLHETIGNWRAVGDTIALVPTMGALHAGHMALVAAARGRARRVVVSIFVNPTQFGPNEDLDRYPRPLDNDLALLRDAGVDAAWLPTVAEMYPEGMASTIKADPKLSSSLDGEFRPGHFDGVATVVTKLLLQVAPDLALFGEKDFQQLAVISKLVAERKIPVSIVGVPTLREADGLALSSRNQYLSKAERAQAVRMNQVLRHSAFVIRNDARPIAETLEKAKVLLLDGGFRSVDYIAYCDAQTLAPLDEYTPHSRLLAAAHLGNTRLIDNIEVE